MVTANPYSYTINHLKLAVAKKHFFFLLNYTKRVEVLLKVLKKLNLIRRFYSSNSKKFVIFPTYTKKAVGSYLRVYYRLRNPIIIRHSALVLINKSLGNSTIIFETSKGLITQAEALKAKIGGVLVCIIS